MLATSLRSKGQKVKISSIFWRVILIAVPFTSAQVNNLLPGKKIARRMSDSIAMKDLDVARVAVKL
jgi:hypothetical protein